MAAQAIARMLADTLYPQKYEPDRDAAFLLRLTQGDIRAASVLDDRVLTPDRTGEWRTAAELTRAAEDVVPKPLHVIFHTGHVGSTLLSRLIDEAPGVLGLREPLPLRTLADMRDARAAAFEPRLALFLKLWARGFADTRAVVVKATSTAGRIAPEILQAAPHARAVYLSLRAEPYLATLLAGANALVDLRGFEAERRNRLTVLLGAPPSVTSIGELAAMTWLAESLTRALALELYGARVLPLDFDAVLADLPATIAAVLLHFAIDAPPALAAQIASSPVLTRYSKAPQQFEYSPHFRAQLLVQARYEHAGEIRRGLSFLERIAARDPRVARLL
jgi:hypothetical protein